MSYRLFLIGDDIPAAKTMADLLRGQGYTLDTASNGEFTADIGLADTFDLIIIDAAPPSVNGQDLCAELRKRKVQTPILMLAPCADVEIKVAAFKAGADDYLTKPVDMIEMQVRIEALLRRAARSGAAKISAYKFDGMRMDFRKSEIIRHGTAIMLSERESRLLQYLVENRGRTVSRNTLLRQVWGYRRAPLTRTVDVHILRLRQKIENDPKNPRFIITVPGLGYRFDGN